MAKPDDLKKIDAEVKKIVTEAADFAVNDAEPAPEELYTDVLVEA
jgi:pyruvate dehydrogenase E1 component alpha subunit